ncbi:alpha/beta hydrolase [Marinobacterium maritimum]
MLRSLLTCLLLLVLPAFAQGATVTSQLNGITLNAEFKQGEGTPDTTVLITHGTLAHNGMELVVALQDALVEAGLNSLAINLSLGIDNRTGAYPCSTPHTHRHQDAIDEIGHWVEWLDQHGQNQILLLGHSRGGNQTAWYVDSARALPTAVRAQVLLAPMTWNVSREAEHYKSRYGHSLERVLEQARQTTQSLLQPVDMLYCTQTAASPSSLLSYYADDSRLHTPNLLKTTRLPTLVIAGSSDTTAPDLITAMAAVDNTQVQLHVLDGADHFFRDLYTYDVVDLIVTLLESTP